jgi:hypothetical protein
MSMFCVARWRSARGMMEWLRTQDRWNPESPVIAIIRGTFISWVRAFRAGVMHPKIYEGGG